MLWPLRFQDYIGFSSFIAEKKKCSIHLNASKYWAIQTSQASAWILNSIEPNNTRTAVCIQTCHMIGHVSNMASGQKGRQEQYPKLATRKMNHPQCFDPSLLCECKVKHDFFQNTKTQEANPPENRANLLLCFDKALAVGKARLYKLLRLRI